MKMKTGKVLLFLTVIFILSFCASSWANIAYTNSTGNLGLIQVNSSEDVEAPSIKYSASIADPFIFSYWSGSNARVVLTDRNKTESGDRLYIFDPVDFSTVQASKDLDGIRGINAAGYSENGRMIFVSSGSKIFGIETSSFNTEVSYDCERIISTDEYVTEIKSIVVDANTVNVLASSGGLDRYIRFDGQLKEGVTFFISRDVTSGASTLAMVNGSLLLAHPYGIDALGSDGQFGRIISTDYPVTAMCADDNAGVYYATQQYINGQYVNTITNSANTDTVFKFQPVTLNSSSPYIQLVRDTTHNMLAVMTAENILIYSVSNGGLMRSFGNSELYGIPVGITATSASGYNPNSSSSGCNASMSCAGLIFCLLMMKYKRK